MQPVVITEPRTEVLGLEVPDPVPGPGDVVEDVAQACQPRGPEASGRGLLLPPPRRRHPVPGRNARAGSAPSGGASRTGGRVTRLRACGPGEGYDEQGSGPAGPGHPVPRRGRDHGGGVPRDGCTVYSKTSSSWPDDSRGTLMVHGRASSGSARWLIQLCKA